MRIFEYCTILFILLQDSVLEAFQEKGLESLSAQVGMVADTNAQVDAATAEKVQKLIDKLEENNDVQSARALLSRRQPRDATHLHLAGTRQPALSQLAQLGVPNDDV